MLLKIILWVFQNTPGYDKYGITPNPRMSFKKATAAKKLVETLGYRLTTGTEMIGSSRICCRKEFC